VDVAAERGDACGLERYRALLVAAIQFEFELVATGEGIDVVAELVVVGEGDLGADRRDEDEGRELLVLLGDLELPRKFRRGRAGNRRECDDSIGERLAVLRCHRDDEVARKSGRCADCERTSEQERLHHHGVKFTLSRLPRRKAPINEWFWRIRDSALLKRCGAH
jgi:hypothetical protein